MRVVSHNVGLRKKDLLLDSYCIGREIVGGVRRDRETRAI